MKILTLQGDNGPSGFTLFLDSISAELTEAIARKLQAYVDAGEVFPSNGLKILKPRIWGYKGTIYKLRVDVGKESVRVLFARSPDNDLVLLHGFIKRTQKTPKKDARIAMENYERVKAGTKLYSVDERLEKTRP